LKSLYKKVILLTLVSLMFFILINRDVFFSKNIAENSFESESKEIGEVNSKNFVNFGDDVAILSDSEFTIFSNNFKKKLNLKHNFSSPIIKNTSFNALIFDNFSDNYKITNKSKVLYSGNTSKKIINGAISEKGNYLFITESDEYCCEMLVLDSNHNKKYKYYFSKIYVTDVSITRNGDTASICGIKAENGKITSVVQIFDFKSEKPIFNCEFGDNLFISIYFFDNKNLIAVGKDFAVSIKNFGIKINKFYYSGMVPCLVSFDKKAVAISFSMTDNEMNQNIVILDKNCNIVSKFSTEKLLKSIFLKNKRITVMYENEIVTYKLDGKICYQKKIPFNSKSFKVIKNNTFLLGNGEIQIIL